MSELSCASLIFSGHSRTETLAALAKLDIRWIDLWDVPHLHAQHVNMLQDDPEQIRRELESFGIRPSALSIYTNDPVRLQAALPFAAGIGAPAVIFNSWGQNVAEFAAFLEPYAEQAARQNLIVAVENHTDNPIDSSDRMRELFRRVSAPNTGVALAPPHSIVVGEPVEDVIRYLGEKLVHFYLWDVAPQNRGLAWWRKYWNDYPAEQFPGNGSLDFTPIITVLQEINHSRPLNFCLHGSHNWSISQITDALEQSIRYLTSHGLELNP